MTERLNQRPSFAWPSAAAALLTLTSLSGTLAQKGVGAPYGARDPRICASTKAPARGAITAAQATTYVTCAQEGLLSGQLYLAEHVKVTVTGSRRYNAYSDSYATSIDTTAPVYPIRGSFDRYQCDKVSAFMENAGKNCNVYHYPNAEGKCYRTTFGDWFCSMHDASNPDATQAVAPPGGKLSVSAPRSTAGNATLPVQSTAAPVTSTTAGRPLPQPDFSQMKAYFQISAPQYDLPGGVLLFTAKITKANNAVDWVVDYYDANGIKVIDTNGVTIVNGDHAAVGDTAKYSFYLPPESMRKNIRRVVISKKVY